MRIIILLIVFLIVGGNCHSQKEDYNWVFGTYGIDADWTGVNILTFTDTSYSLKRNPDLVIGHQWTSTSLSDIKGKLYLHSNGMQIYEGNFHTVNGGKKINYNEFWELFYGKFSWGEITRGLRLSQGMLMLPYPEKDSIFYASYNRQIIDGTLEREFCKGLYTGIIDVGKSEQEVVLKDYLVTEDSLSPSSLQACRHANGRDWWIVAPGHFHNKMYIFLLEPSGIKLHAIQPIAINYPMGVGQASFSPNGNKYVLYEIENGTIINNFFLGHLSILDFDRNTGVFSNLIKDTFMGLSFVVGCAISFDSKFLYTANATYLYQYNLESDNILTSKKLIAFADGFKSDYGNGFLAINDFGFMQLAPDGKIYGPGGNTLHMHRIEYPDEEGEACYVNQHILKTSDNNNTIPNFPHFRLGPLDGSPADTLGIDNHPIAKFRYEQDTINHLNVRFTDLSYFRPETWHWDFDDGTTFEGRKPYWHEFPKNGTYNVCLTVSNENSINTMCRMVTIGSTSVSDTIRNQQLAKVVSVFPNPTEGEVLLTVSDYIPEKGMVYVYDMMGREVYKQKVYYGWNNVDLTFLVHGTYLYIVKDGLGKVGSGNLIRI